MLDKINESPEGVRHVAATDMPDGLRIAFLIPCYNEEVTIFDVVSDFRRELPGAVVYVFDNNSSDRTAEQAAQAGAIVCHERRQGKGYVVQRMFQHIDADVYVLVDGDGTYPPASVHQLIAPVIAGEADTVVGSRLHTDARSDFRFLNRLGNKIFQHSLNLLFRVELTDILSGYRAFSRRFVKDIPLFGGGFEIETELTIKAISRGYRIVEVPVDLSSRPPNSHSKISLFRDGFIILNTILALFRDYKPLTFFGATGVALVTCGLLLGASLWMWAGKSYAVILVSGTALVLFFVGSLAVSVGLILHTVTRRAQEQEYQMRMIMDELGGRDTKPL